jgi:hypothetical protein
MRRSSKALALSLVIIAFITTTACGMVTSFFEDGSNDYGGDYYDGYEDYATEAAPDFAPDTNQDQYSSADTASCTNLLNGIVTAEQSASDNADVPLDNNSGRYDDEFQYIASYKVNGDQISNPQYETVDSSLQAYQDDTALHTKIWDYFIALIPAEQRTEVTEFIIYTDGPSNVLAAVEQSPNDPARWVLEIDIADSSDFKPLTFTLIHEYGHLLTLNADQVPPDENVFANPDDDAIYEQAADACPVYFPGEGCSQPDSYINAFYDRFWADLFDEWLDIELEQDDDVYYQRLDEFYYKYEDQFVSDYAATNPEEDIAESWTYFVLGPKPAGNSIAEEKILFFYDYPELVNLRTHIRNGICDNLK